MKYIVTVGGTETPVVVELRDDGRYEVNVSGTTRVVDLRRAGGSSLWSLLIGARSCEVSASHHDDETRVTLRGATVALRVESEQQRNARALGRTSDVPRATVVKSSMPGIIARIFVKVGDRVERGTSLLIVEAMKMENEVRAEAPGVVTEVVVRERQTVNGGDILVRLGL